MFRHRVLCKFQAFDGVTSTKWLDFGAAGGGTAWLEYRLPPGAPAATVLRYALTSADDAPERDPRDWTLEGLLDDGEASGGSAGAAADCCWNADALLLTFEHCM